MKNLKLSERFMYYSGLLVAMKGTDVVDDLTHIANLLEREEQGLLLRLPCKVGETVYHIYADDCGNQPCSDVCYECEYAIWKMRECAFNSLMFDDVGVSVFLTRAEAEKALAEMGG